MHRSAVLAVLLLTACPSEDSDTEPLLETCGDTAPEIVDLTVENTGMRDFSGESYPALLLQAHATDADSDLEWYTVQVWWDDVVDGIVSRESTPAEVNGNLSGEDCAVADADLGIYLAVTGDGIPYEAEIEFGVVVKDAAAHRSNGGEPVTVVFTTPNAAGE